MQPAYNKPMVQIVLWTLNLQLGTKMSGWIITFVQTPSTKGFMLLALWQIIGDFRDPPPPPLYFDMIYCVFTHTCCQGCHGQEKSWKNDFFFQGHRILYQVREILTSSSKSVKSLGISFLPIHKVCKEFP